MGLREVSGPGPSWDGCLGWFGSFTPRQEDARGAVSLFAVLVSLQSSRGSGELSQLWPPRGGNPGLEVKSLSWSPSWEAVARVKARHPATSSGPGSGPGSRGPASDLVCSGPPADQCFLGAGRRHRGEEEVCSVAPERSQHPVGEAARSPESRKENQNPLFLRLWTSGPRFQSPPPA